MRIYYDSLENLITLPENITRHLTVNHFKPGEQIFIFNHKEEALYKIKEITKKAVLEFQKTVRKAREKKYSLTLIQGKLEKNKYDELFKRLTELNVCEYIIVNTEKTKFPKANIINERLEKIIISATEQSERLSEFKIKEMPFSELSELIKKYDKTIVCDFSEGQPRKLKNLLTKENKNYLILIGPEGGFSTKERSLFKELKLPVASLSSLTLRAETAPLFVASVFESELDA